MLEVFLKSENWKTLVQICFEDEQKSPPTLPIWLPSMFTTSIIQW
jgi:hypothetical protein